MAVCLDPPPDPPPPPPNTFDLPILLSCSIASFVSIILDKFNYNDFIKSIISTKLMSL